MTNALSSLTLSQLKRALQIKEQIEALQTEINGILGAPVEAPVDGPAVRGRKRFSAAARRKMAAAQRARWAAKSGEAAVEEAHAPRRGRKRVSAAARARMAASQRARRAAERGESVPSAPAAAKPKKKFNAAARARLSDAAKARWARAKAAGKTAL